MLILYVAMFGAAVGVRDAGHIGMESLLVLVSEKWRLRLEIVIHVLVGTFGALMVVRRLGAHVGRAVVQDSDARHLRRAGTTRRSSSPAR